MLMGCCVILQGGDNFGEGSLDIRQVKNP